MPPKTGFSAYAGKRVLVTGHTGFKGSWLCEWLTLIGAEVRGFSDRVLSFPSHYELLGKKGDKKNAFGDVRRLEDISTIVEEFDPDFIFHLAAQPLVRAAYDNPVDTIITNSIGTVNLLEVLRKRRRKCVAIFITSDKVYRNDGWIWGYRENDALGWDEPYSASKTMAEFAIQCYLNSYFLGGNSCVRLAIARAGNVIGGGDFAADRIIPDAFKSWALGNALKIRNPDATRPWQHVLEPLSGYLDLGLKLNQNYELNGQAFNFGPRPEEIFTVAQVAQLLKEHWEGFEWECERSSCGRAVEAKLLNLSIEKAGSMLGWCPRFSLRKTIRYTAGWYAAYRKRSAGENMVTITRAQIADYAALLDED